MRVISTSLILLSVAVSFADQGIIADPDYIATGFEYCGSSEISMGTRFRRGALSVGGMLEARNEKRFNEVVLPNHNWRGIGSVGLGKTIGSPSSSHWKLSGRIKHESAHATMGIYETTTQACEMIYDHQYRKFILNSLGLSGIISMPLSNGRLQTMGGYQLYVFSKNTPELLEHDLNNSHGISLGAEYSKPALGSSVFFLSIFNRHIFEGSKKILGSVYCGDDSALSLDRILYPVIASVNTVTAKLGICLKLGSSGRLIKVFVRALQGNIYGYVDSRDTRTRFSVGMEL